jgi:hypothetical protein
MYGIEVGGVGWGIDRIRQGSWQILQEINGDTDLCSQLIC